MRCFDYVPELHKFSFTITKYTVKFLNFQTPENFAVIYLKFKQNGQTLEYLSRDVRKPDFCICENKDADQLRGNREADQRLCFRYTDSTVPLVSKSEISSLYLFSEAVQPSLCGTWSETPKTGFLRTRLIS